MTGGGACNYFDHGATLVEKELMESGYLKASCYLSESLKSILVAQDPLHVPFTYNC